ncbi:MAG: hypothetical protein A3G87_09115 [Omnitrophica bacterium RIFCSPLOWO2_12_FULL_50_11]|nr:MAG: hypothetical protein A3G87_09115 [Omnitrophica bacterium RIFCSPLOWO2_12_FULL_50_11]
MSKQTGVTMLELVLVLVIVAIGGALAYPAVRRGIENQEAKNALRTLRTMTQAIRMYELDHGCDFSTLSPNPCPAVNKADPIAALADEGWLNPNEYAPVFQYQFLGSSRGLSGAALIPIVQAFKPDESACGVFLGRSRSPAQRCIRLYGYGESGSQVIKGEDGLVWDSGGFLSSNSS